jgi:putative flippase GtrA
VALGSGPTREGEGARGLVPQLTLFLVTGGLATAAHYVLLGGLIELGDLSPTLATCLGFAGAAALNYWLRRRFVFRSTARVRRTAPRYAAVAGVGFGLNGGTMALAEGVFGLPYAAVQVVATGLVTAWNFAAHRLWTFRDGAAAGAPG